MVQIDIPRRTEITRIREIVRRRGPREGSCQPGGNTARGIITEGSFTGIDRDQAVTTSVDAIKHPLIVQIVDLPIRHKRCPEGRAAYGRGGLRLRKRSGSRSQRPCELS